MLKYRIFIVWIATFIVNIITLAIIVAQGKVSRSVVLHYNVIVGAEYFGDASNNYKIPAIGLFILVFNTVMYVFLRRAKQDFLAEVSIYTTLLVSIVLLVAYMFLLSIN